MFNEVRLAPDLLWVNLNTVEIVGVKSEFLHTHLFTLLFMTLNQRFTNFQTRFLWFIRLC